MCRMPGVDSDERCMACRANRGELHAPGGVILDDGHWRVEHMLAPAVLPGWLIVKTLRHVESLSGLTEAESAALGPLLARVTAALEGVTGAERVYTCLFAEAVRHVHFHIIPRRASLAPTSQGWAVFSGLRAHLTGTALRLRPRAFRGPGIFFLPPTAAEDTCAAVGLRVADRLREHRDTAV